MAPIAADRRRAGGAARSAGRPIAAALAVALAVLLPACSSLINIDRPIGMPDPVKQSEAAPAQQREHRRILAAYGGAYTDAKLEAMIAGMVDRLVAASERPEQRFKVTILNSPAINAFALQSGQLYITRGLLALANDDAELASVLAHEMAHVVAHHAEIRESEARRAAIVANATVGAVNDSTGALALAKSKLAFASFSRAQEFEADGIGVGIAARAGYDPHGAVRFLTSMSNFGGLRSASSSDPRSLDFLSSHPATPERIENAANNARQYVGGARVAADYLATLDKLVYGEDPIEGFVRGRRFVHPKLGFAFTAPEGFNLENTAQAVLGAKQGGDEALRLDIVRLETEPALASYINSGWIESIEPGSVEDRVIAGFPAATATAKGEDWWFRLYVVRYGKEIFRFIFASKTKTSEIDRAFRESINTFRRLSLAEASSVKPLRIKIVTVAPSDTVDRLAARMALLDRQAERFRALNGLGPNDQLKPGRRVKIVVE
jgi:predicted Zn-dependent protease